MNKEELIQKLIKGTMRRAIQETIACVVVLIAFVSILQRSISGSAEYYGCLLILVSTGFIAGVIWSFTLSYRLLRIHPASDSTFWHEAFLTQARLLRLVPLWYLAPVCSGLLLTYVPKAGETLSPFLVELLIIGFVFAVITWMNRHGANQLEEQAEAIRA